MNLCKTLHAYYVCKLRILTLLDKAKKDMLAFVTDVMTFGVREVKGNRDGLHLKPFNSYLYTTYTQKRGCNLKKVGSYLIDECLFANCS